MISDSSPASAVPYRRDLPQEQCWDLESMFATPQAFFLHLERIDRRLAELDQYRGRLGATAALLRDGLALRDELFAELDRLRTYGVLRMSEDAGDPARIELRDRALALQTRGKSAMAFFEPEIVAIDPAKLDQFCDTDPGLAVYRYYFNVVQQRAAAVRSPEVEEVLSNVDAPLGSFEWIHAALTDGDLRFGAIRDEMGNSVELQQNNRFRYLHSQDRSVRQAAWTAYTDAYLNHRNMLAANYSGAVKANVFRARSRGYNSAADAALARQRVPRTLLDMTIETVWRHFPIWQRYFSVRARLLGIERACGWDISEMPIPRPDRTPIPFIPYAEGLAHVGRALAPLGDAYRAALDLAIAERWIDPLPNQGKFSGAFSSGSYLTRPFLCLNWAGDLAAVSVLAHELGHSIHSHFSWMHQPYVYGYYSDIVAEAVSNLHQFLLADHLLGTIGDPELVIGIIEERMGYGLRYLFTMPLLARFELNAHTLVERGGALTADGMIAAMADLYRAGYGDAVAIDHDRMGIAWATFSHLYGGFYVYQYATGMAVGAALARQIRQEGQPAIDRLLHLLSAGSSADSIELLEAAGVDLHTPEPIDAAFRLLNTYIDRLEQLM